jgi:hypothetical protein
MSSGLEPDLIFGNRLLCSKLRGRRLYHGDVYPFTIAGVESDLLYDLNISRR